MSRALTVENVLDKKFPVFQFEGHWFRACGNPQRGGQTWFISGDTKMGKTTFALMLGKMLTKFGKVDYDTIEEGFCESIKTAYKRVGMEEVKGKFLLLDRVEIPELIERMQRRKSSSFYFIDSVQFAGLTLKEYLRLKWLSNELGKTIIYLSHIEGKKPQGTVAQMIKKDAALSWFIEGFTAIPTSRYHSEKTTGESIIINQDLADKYWGLKNL